MTIESLIASYPRTRPPLSQAVSDIFVETYQASRQGKGIVYGITQWLESWMHHKVAGIKHGASVLEIGAGTLNHLPYESSYTTYDIIEPFKELFAGSLMLAKVSTVYDDITAIPTEKKYDRIVSVATLEHLTDLPKSLARAGLLLNERGVFQAGIPSEGGFLWGTTWRTTVGINFRLRTGLDYGELMRHEHVNDAREIIGLVNYFFADVRVKWFPLPHRHLSLYGYIEARTPNITRCREILSHV